MLSNYLPNIHRQICFIYIKMYNANLQKHAVFAVRTFVRDRITQNVNGDEIVMKK